MLRRSLFFAPLLLTVATVAGDARADAVPFGAHDVATIFFISKSDDHNRVDYAIHLDAHCVPVHDDAMYFYWREFEKAPPVRTPTR